MILTEAKPLPCLQVQVVEPRQAPKPGWEACELGSNIKFCSESLESYLCAGSEQIAIDALVVAAVVEFCDRRRRRPALGWAREFRLRIPVHTPDQWNAEPVRGSLISALNFLSGDIWNIDFIKRKVPEKRKAQGLLDLPTDIRAVIPFSKGMDSRSVAGLEGKKYGSVLVRIRVGSEKRDEIACTKGKRQPFTSIPYEVSGKGRSLPETSARTRGFKFAIVSAIAAYLAQAEEVIVPESGQGALGPALVPVGHAYEDYRNHPMFMRRMERFVTALFHRRIKYLFPRLWFTKGETLRSFTEECEEGETWVRTWSCWQQSRHSSVLGKKRQCGVCAACMLRRVSVHAAQLEESPARYVWEDLRAASFQAGVADAFPARRVTSAMREYAIAGTLHMEHLAQLEAGEVNAQVLAKTAYHVGRAEGLNSADALARLRRVFEQHTKEWREFSDSLGPQSFVKQWLRAA